MVCPFKCGVSLQYTYIGKDNSPEERSKADNYIEIAQHAFFEKCDGQECPYYNYNGLCDRGVGGD